VAIDFASREALCPVHGQTKRISVEDRLVLPMAKSMVAQVLPGETALTLFHGDKEISFETPGQIAFGLALSRQTAFRAGDAAEWTDLGWDEVAEMLAELVAAGVLTRAEDLEDGFAISREDHPSPLPPAVATRPSSWRDEGLIEALTGRALDRGWLEAVVPIFRIIHPCLDGDGRQVGEGNVFPKALRLDMPTQWRTCTYSGTRYQPERPINVTALKAMRSHWGEMMAVLREMRAAYLRRFPEAGLGWTAGHVERLSALVLALPSLLMMREQGAVANGALHPVLSNLFRVTDGLRMAVHQMMFVPVAEAMLSPDAPTSADEIFAYAERNFSFHSEHGVCAGPEFMIREFLAVLIDGDAPKAGWPASLSPEVERALAEIEPAIDYGLLGLQSHAAAFSLWPAMARAFDRIAEALAAADGESETAHAFASHRQKMETRSYLGREEWRRHRESVYAEIVEGSALGELSRAFTAESPAAAPSLVAELLSHLRGRAGAGVAEPVAIFISRGQAILCQVEASQAGINRLLGRPEPRRRLTLRDLDIHNKLITGQERSLPFLLDELDQHFGLAIDADADGIRILGSADHPFDGPSPIDTQRASRAPTQGD
jgi:hypothetical protein